MKEVRVQFAASQLLGTSRPTIKHSYGRYLKVALVAAASALASVLAIKAVADPECDCLTYGGIEYKLPEALRLVSLCLALKDGADMLPKHAYDALLASRLPFDRDADDVKQAMIDACRSFRTASRDPDRWSF